MDGSLGLSRGSPAALRLLFDGTEPVLVLQAATAEAALLYFTLTTWVVRQGAAATSLTVYPGFGGENTYK